MILIYYALASRFCKFVTALVTAVDVELEFVSKDLIHLAIHLSLWFPISKYFSN